MHKDLLFLLPLAAVVAPAYGAEWLTDLDAAKTRAAAEGKSVLIEFTGSDWCGPCIRMKQAVLETESFARYVQDKFVLVEVDVPRNPKFSKERLLLNRRVCGQFHVQTMPTVIVISPEGQVLGGFKGSKTEVDVVLPLLEEAHHNAGLFRKAGKQRGIQRARTLWEVHKAIPEELRELSKLEAEVRAADPDNLTGVRDAELLEAEWKLIEGRLAAAAGNPAKEDAVLVEAMESAMPPNVVRARQLQQDLALQRVLAQAYSLRGEPAKAAAVLEKAIENCDIPAARYQMRAYLVQYQLRAAKTVDDVMKAKATMLQSIEDCPDNELRIRVNAENLFSDPEALLRKNGSRP